MEKIIGNELATPVSASYSDEAPNVLIPVGGLTIRQHFAAMAMQGLIGTIVSANVQDLAKASVIAADALITELNNPTPAG